MADGANFILGLDLDGVVADFYGTIRPLAAEWLGKPLDDLTESPTYGLHEWGFNGSGAEYQKFHRWAVVQRRLFSSLAPIPGAAPALRRLSDDKVRIRIITNRLFIPHFHAPAVAQTVEWLDVHGVPYWDLCLMPDKTAVQANVCLEDTPTNIEELRAAGADVIIFENSTNLATLGIRARDWTEAEALIRERLRSYVPAAPVPSREELLEESPET
jgi:beta-phosphoglucomutase-like phosphatase (HAD superfamily)